MDSLSLGNSFIQLYFHYPAVPVSSFESTSTTYDEYTWFSNVRFLSSFVSLTKQIGWLHLISRELQQIEE